MNGTAGSSSVVRTGLRNAGWSSLDYVVLPLLWLLTTPYFLASLGPDSYGIWMLVNAFVGFSGVAGFGLGDATIRFIATYRTLGDNEGLIRVIRLTSFTFAVLGLLIPTVTYLSATFLVTEVFSVHREASAMAVTAFRIGGIGIAVRLLDSIPTAILHGFERFDVSARIRIPTTIFTMAVNVLLVFLGYSVIELMASSVLILLAGAVAKIACVGNVLPLRLALFAKLPRVPMREVRHFALNSWLQAAGGTLLSQADRLLVASLTGTRSLTYYTICVQFSQQIHALLAQALSFLLPMASGFQAGGDLGRLRKTYFAATNIVIAIAVTIGIPAFLLSHEILELWIDTSFANEASGLLSAFVVAFTLLSTSIVPHYIMNAMGYYRLNTVLSLLAGVFVAAATFLLVPVMGVLGAAVARLLSLPISIVGRTIIHFRVVNDKRWSAGLTIFVPLMLLFAVLGALQGAAMFEAMEGWGKALVVSTITIVGTILVALYLLAFNRGRTGDSEPAPVT